MFVAVECGNRPQNISHLNVVVQLCLSNVYRYQNYHAQHHQVLTAPTVASFVNQSRASWLSRAAASLQRNGPKWPTTRLGATDQNVIQSTTLPEHRLAKHAMNWVPSNGRRRRGRPRNTWRFQPPRRTSTTWTCHGILRRSRHWREMHGGLLLTDMWKDTGGPKSK